MRLLIFTGIKIDKVNIFPLDFNKVVENIVIVHRYMILK